MDTFDSSVRSLQRQLQDQSSCHNKSFNYNIPSLNGSYSIFDTVTLVMINLYVSIVVYGLAKIKSNLFGFLVQRDAIVNCQFCSSLWSIKIHDCEHSKTNR